eukprot:4010862-Lingulodinium_polyedra.AAC.1
MLQQGAGGAQSHQSQAARPHACHTPAMQHVTVGRGHGLGRHWLEAIKVQHWHPMQVLVGLLPCQEE